MHIDVDIPKNLEQILAAEWGDLSTAAKEALAIESYRTGKISLGLLAEMLGLSVIEADRWLSQRGIPLNYSPEDLEADRRDLAELFPEMRR